jgi:hypothetical protein
MKVCLSILTVLVLAASLAVAGQIDGKWVSERTMNRGGEEVTIRQTFDLKSDGDKLTGTVSMQMGQMEPRTTEIQEGKIEGNKFSFKTVMETPNGSMTTVYEGTVEGDVLKGTSQREGGQGQGRPFEAKRVPAS